MRSLGFVLASLALAACTSGDITSPTPLRASAASRAGEESVGAVFTLTNQASNAVRSYARASDGTLTFVGDFATGGTGAGAVLGSQGALAFGRGQTLLAVNAASNEISSLAIDGAQLTLITHVASGGTNPTSVTSSGDLVYVLNTGTPANISGFRQDEHGALTPIPNSTRPLSAASPAAAEIAFSPRGDVLVVTERATNRIVTYTIGNDGTPSGPQVTPAAGITPFGFAFTARGDYLIVSEAFAGAPNGSATSSYKVDQLGGVSVRTPSLSGAQTAACWVATTPNNQFAYTANAASQSVTGYRINPDGTLALLDPSGVSAHVVGTALDASVSRNGRFLYVLGNSSHALNAFAIAADGALTPIGVTPGLPVGTVSVLAQ